MLQVKRSTSEGHEGGTLDGPGDGDEAVLFPVCGCVAPPTRTAKRFSTVVVSPRRLPLLELYISLLSDELGLQYVDWIYAAQSSN